jgi:hypothetical protein
MEWSEEIKFEIEFIIRDLENYLNNKEKDIHCKDPEDMIIKAIERLHLQIIKIRKARF